MILTIRTISVIWMFDSWSNKSFFNFDMLKFIRKIYHDNLSIVEIPELFNVYCILFFFKFLLFNENKKNIQYKLKFI